MTYEEMKLPENIDKFYRILDLRYGHYVSFSRSFWDYRQIDYPKKGRLLVNVGDGHWCHELDKSYYDFVEQPERIQWLKK